METMKAKPIEGKAALKEFTRTMKALFRVSKFEVVDKPKSKPRTPRKATA